ncbi:AAA family ATPase [Cystobacter ferrugineus]|uniref:Chromosome segregation protein SMC n=1 Tax=Cystobacter ferrugineus TaxID=83449 RepID=A0A1L9B8L8_9BACT|nr:AAA family ATPase [Cystobacter ferrugineus]OJH38605.1 chromosome segregation protein SMC [Cystobacter ferrugineus]
MSLESLRLQNLLSFGPDSEAITFGPLNVVIGPNGSGKSNLIEAIGLLLSTPNSLSDAIRDGGGVGEWLWKGSKGKKTAHLEAVMRRPLTTAHPIPSLKYQLSFTQTHQRTEILDERIEEAAPVPESEPVVYFGYINGRPSIRLQGSPREIDTNGFKTTESILSQRRDPEVYPELFWLTVILQNSELYRDWSFGRYSPPRIPQPADLPNFHLMRDARNLGLVLNQIRKDPETREELLKYLALMYEGVRDVDVSIEGGTVQTVLHEHKWVIPATRLSDGTLRWLSLLAILLNPHPQLLVCIEEPEIGLHPDLMPPLANLLREASRNMQLVVTTHSDALIDALSDTPESVLVCEKHEGSTTMRRLDKAALSDWLDKYTLGQLWRRGELGGNRW